MKVWRKYEDFLEELYSKFPHERKGIKKFYDACWRVFNALNSLELKSLEEPRYLLGGKSSPAPDISMNITPCLQSTMSCMNRFKQ